MNRIKEYEETPQERAWLSQEDGQLSPEWPQEGSISMKGLFLKYRQDLDYVLRGVSINIKPGEKVVGSILCLTM